MDEFSITFDPGVTVTREGSDQGGEETTDEQENENVVAFDSGGENENVVAFDPGVEVTRKGLARACRCRDFLLDLSNRRVTCRRCKKVLDPYDCLEMYAEFGARQAQTQKDAEEVAADIYRLLEMEGRLNISNRGIFACVRRNGRDFKHKGYGFGKSLFGEMRDAIKGLENALQFNLIRGRKGR